MDREIWIQVLLAVSIIAVGFLIAVFWRLLGVLADAKKVSAIAARRVEQADELIDKTENGVKHIADTMKGILYSMDIVKAIREKFNSKEKE